MMSGAHGSPYQVGSIITLGTHMSLDSQLLDVRPESASGGKTSLGMHLPTCCGDDSGTCIPTEALPQRAIDGLTQKSCEEQSMCVPNVMLDTTFEGEPCAPDIILQMLGIDDGACLPECLAAVSGIGRGSCGPGYKCAPCDALGESTGACGDPW